MLEPRENPASISWIGATGGDWNIAANWSNFTIPTGADDVSISLPSNQSVAVPDFYIAYAGSLSCTARIEVDGTLNISGNSAVSGAFDVNGMVLVGAPPPQPPGGGDDDPPPPPPPAYEPPLPSVAPGDELSLLPYLGGSGGLRLTGGATVTGKIETADRWQTTIAAGQLLVTNGGILTGAGWFSAVDAEMTFNGPTATLTHLYGGSNAVIDGTADVNTTASLIAADATFTGLAGSTINVLGSAYFVAPLLTATTFAVRNFYSQLLSGVTIDGDVNLTQGQTSTYTGTVNWAKGNISITGQSQIINCGVFNIKDSNKVTGGPGPAGTFNNSSRITFGIRANASKSP